jgi:glycosyltransferase involved in cell wall biosynthesis
MIRFFRSKYLLNKSPLEAMACGTPVVTADSGEVLDFCQHLHNAYITPPKNPIAIVQGIIRVLSNPSLSDQFIQNGLHQASQMTKRRFEKDIVEALEQIAEQRKWGVWRVYQPTVG